MILFTLSVFICFLLETTYQKIENLQCGDPLWQVRQEQLYSTDPTTTWCFLRWSFEGMVSSV
jgi:hypothetical protein